MRERLLIFAVALVVRCGLAWLFFGSVDTSNDFLNAARMFAGWNATQIPIPYFPGIQLILWLGGMVATYTDLPLTFGWKFIGAFFDAVLALLVYDYLAAHRPRALRYGLLYAFAPVPLIIACIHGQRDAATIAFLLLSFLLLTKKTRLASALAGAAVVLSLIVKPIAIPFLPLLFVAPWAYFRGEGAKERREQAAMLIGGAVVTAALYLMITAAAGAPVTFNVVKKVFTYAEQGVQIFGMPLLLGSRPNRLISLLPLLLLYPAYWKGMISRERVLLIALAFLFATTGLGPQYLMWLVPLLLVCGHYRFAAFYSLIAGWFLVIHYHHPGPAGFNMENLGAFGPMRGASWLTPVPVLLGANSFLYVFLSSFLLPLSCLIFVALQALHIYKTRPAAETFETPVTPLRLVAPAAAGLAIVAAVGFWALSRPEPTVREFENVLRKKVLDYDVVRYRGPGLRNPKEPTWVVPAYVAEAPMAKVVDAVTIAYAWVALWSAAAWMSHGRRSNRLAVFAVALLVRGVLAWIFFGSVDTTNDFLNTARMYGGIRAADLKLPYFPGIQLILWAAGVWAVYTPLPLTFVYKIFGCLFDSVLAVAVHDYFAGDRGRALKAGLFYALAPVPIIISAIHGQRDGFCIAFLLLAFLLVSKRTARASALAGAAFAISIILKPIALPLAPLLLPSPWALARGDDAPQHRRRALAVIGGAVAAVAVYLLVLLAADELMTLSHYAYLTSYANAGPGTVGLPWVLGTGYSRQLTALLLIAPLAMYWTGRLSREHAAPVIYALFLATGDYSTQYLLWIVPFLLINRQYRFAALYNVLAGLFLVTHYHHPGPHRFNFHNLGAFGPLQSMEWLAPAATGVPQKTVLYLVVSCLAIPLACLGYALYVMITRWRARTPDEERSTPLSIRRLVTPFVAAALLLAIVIGYAFTKPEPTLDQYTGTIARKVGEYAVHLYRGYGLHEPTEPTWVIPAYAENLKGPPARVIDAATLGYGWVILWSCVALAAAGIRRVRFAAFAVTAMMICHAIAVWRLMIRRPNDDEAEYLHAAWLMGEGWRIYRDFFEHHSPLFFQVLSTLVPWPNLPLMDYVVRARFLVALLGTIAVLAAAWLAYRFSRSAAAAVVVCALLLTPAWVWLRAISDIRSDAPSLMLFWVGAALLLLPWSTPRRDALAAGIGIGLAFASALMNPKWPLVCFFLGVVFLVKLWKLRRMAHYALVPAAAIALLTVFTITRATTLRDFMNFTFDYSMRIGAWWTTNEHHRGVYSSPGRFLAASFKGVYPLLAFAGAIALLAVRKLRERFDAAQRWQLGAAIALAILAALEVRFVSPWPLLAPQTFLMWCFAAALLYATVAGLAIELVPERLRGRVAVVVMATAMLLFIERFEWRMRPNVFARDFFWTANDHIRKNLRKGDAVWIGAANHPILAPDAHYYWFGYAQHIIFVLDLQKRGELPAYLPRVTEDDLPPCRALRGEDRHLRFMVIGSDIDRLPRATQCAEALLASGKAKTDLRLRGVAELQR